MKNLNNKSKKEQLFILILFCMMGFAFICLTGCNGSSCETLKFNCVNENGLDAKGCSIPGCGGLLTPNKGCSGCLACLWPQSCKILTGKMTDTQGNKNSNKTVLGKLTGCDVRYIASDRLGCSHSEKSCYAGCVTNDQEDSKANGFFYGTDEEETIVGCYNGCGGCVGSDGMFGFYLYLLEEELGIN